MQKAEYTVVPLGELLTHVQQLKGAGAHFTQMHAEHNADGERFDVVYTFVNVQESLVHTKAGEDYQVQNLVVEGITAADELPSICDFYPAVFPFENEAHDLFGIHIVNMKMDFQGYFYHVAVKEPMSIVSPEVKAAREKAAKVRAAQEAKARKAAAAKAAAEGTAPAAPAGNDAKIGDAQAKAALKAAEMEAKLASMDPEKAAKVRAALAAKAAKDKAKAQAADAAVPAAAAEEAK